MDEKSHVSLEQNVCAVCGKVFDTNAILLDERLRPRFSRHTVTGFGLCEEHQKLHDGDYVALVAIDESKSSSHKIEDVYRTGSVAHVRRQVAKQIFDVDIGTGPLVFCEPEVIDRLQEMMPA